MFRPGTKFEEALRKEHPLTEIGARQDLGMEVHVYLQQPRDPFPPVWTTFVSEAVVEDLPDLSTQVSGAVLLAQRGDRLWALTFGQGFLYVNDDRIEPRFGLRTVLNVVDPDKLLSVGSKVIEDVVVSTSRQASRRASREVFTIDDTRDILREVVGTPLDEVAFGKQVIGSGALTLSVPVEVAGLGQFLDRIEASHARVDYKRHFAFIDFIAPVQDAATVARLDQELVEVVAGRREGDAYLATPEPILYEDLGGFLHFRERHTEVHPELDLQDYRHQIDIDTFGPDSLQNHQIRMIAASNSAEMRSWSVYRCLVYETEYDGTHYLLSEGDWFAVDRDFVHRVNTEVAAIPGVDLGLPSAHPGEQEADYNRRAAEECGMALLDRRTVGIGGNSIELADLLSGGGHLIHIKRKTQSSTLSHLFAQGRISAEALKTDDSLRRDVAATLSAEGQAAAPLFAAVPFRASDLTVVYGVIAPNADALPRKLPFFSRLNLWRARRFLAATLDYNVAFCGIPLETGGR